MVRNNIISAIRSIRRNKLTSFINIVSLAIGISAVAVVYLAVQHEWSYDKHALHKERISRVVWEGWNGKMKIAAVETPLIQVIEEEIAGIELVIPIFQAFDYRMNSLNTEGEKRMYQKEKGLVFTNSNYFAIYPHHWLSGNPEQLNHPNKMVLTEKELKQFFPNITPSEAVGKTLLYEEDVQFEVVGVVKEMKENSDFKFSSFGSFSSISTNPELKEEFGWERWGQVSDARQCLLLLNKGKNLEEIEREITQIAAKHSSVENDNNSKYALQSLADVHFNLEYNYEAMDKRTLRNLILLAVFLLLLGVVNFVNLSTAQSVERAKEIGVRKTLGSSKAELRQQFLVETFLITILASLVALILLPLFLEVFKNFIPEMENVYQTSFFKMLIFLIGFIPAVTFLAGFYPAWVLTGYAPISIMKNQMHQNSHLSRTSVLRQGLTVFQFVIASVFLICVWIVIQQTHFLLNRDIGMKKEAIVSFYIPGYFQNAEKANILKNRLKGFSELMEVSLGSQPPVREGYNKNQVTLDYPKHKDLERVELDVREGDLEYANVYQFELKAGRNLQLLDSVQEIWINEKAMQYFGFSNPEEVIGQTLDKGSKTIVGVLKDFDISSAHESLRPFMFVGSKRGYMIHVALNAEHPETWSGALSKISDAFKDVFPEDTFEYSFYDKELENLYESERKLAKLLQWAMIFSILIAGMGLFGLTVFTTNQRIKEIGIRKTLGASTGQIIYMLLKNLSKLVLIACFIAFPIAWYFMQEWLTNFVYRIEINPLIFLGSTFVLLLVAIIVMLFRGWFIARANPVDSLRDE